MGNRKTFGAALLLVVGMIACAGSASADSIRWAKNYKSALAASKSSGKLIMVDFYTDWCKWCKVLDQKVYPDSQIVGEARRFSSVKVNAEKEGKALAARYGIHTYPNILFINSSEDAVYSIGGYAPTEMFLKEMGQALKAENDHRRYKATLAKNPSDFEALVGMGRINAKAERMDKAKQYLSKADRVTPKGGSDNLAEVYMDIGALQAAQQDMGGAASYFKKAAAKAKSPNSKFEAKVNLAVAYAKQNELAQATSTLEDSLRIKGVDANKVQQVRQFLAQVKSARAGGS